MKKYLAVALLAALLTPATGVARDAWYNGIYLGGGVGAGRIEADLVELGLMPVDAMGNPEPIESSEFKKTSLTGKFFVGWRFARFFGIEAGYAEFFDVERQYCFVDDTGECTESRGDPQGAVTPATSSSAWTVELPTSGIAVYAIGFLPFAQDKFDVFLKVGAVNWETEANAYERVVGGFVPPKLPLVPPTNPPITKTADGTDLATGLGVNFNHPSGVTIRSEFEYFDIGEADKSYLLSLSVLYTF